MSSGSSRQQEMYATLGDLFASTSELGDRVDQVVDDEGAIRKVDKTILKEIEKSAAAVENILPIATRFKNDIGRDVLESAEQLAARARAILNQAA